MIERNNQAIAQLKNLLDQELLSVIVGAGFSKNASSKFLSWKELLKEMILEMYEFNAKQSYEYSRIRGTRCESKFWETFINQVIREKGYLSIASEYVKRYGYREVIDEYIEKKTPLIDDENEKEYNLDIHKLLLDIQWNNVYTFNYDNLLEKAAGEEYKIISCEINNLEKRICKIDENISEYEEKLRRAEELIEKDTEKTNIDTSNKKLNRNFSKKSSEDADQVKLKNEKSVIDDDVKCLKNEKINIKFTIDRKKKLQRNIYYIVEDSSELSIRKRKNIIKLHGTRNSNNKGFDNDPNCKYIITEEDYLEYDKKHDAFVNLMRIALLQDSFCLIGFSGDDPNFMSWLKWVRNVLDRKANKENYKKIYFVDVSGKPLSTSKKLFFQNHYIQHVPLFDSDENVNEASIKERLTEFLKELNRESYTENIYKHGNYLWENYKFNISDVEYLHGININEIREAWEYRHYNSLPSLKQDFIGAKQRILIEIKQKLLKTNNLEENSARLFVMAIKDDFLPLDLIIDSDIYENLNIIMKRYDDVYNEFKYLHIRCLNLNGKDISSFNDYSDSYKYESILNSAFNLDFKLLKSRLEEWQPDDLRFKRKKIAFLTLFRYLEYSDYSSFFEKELGTNNQEYLYFLETLQRATYISRFNRSEINQVDEIKEKIDNENKDQNQIDDNVEYLKEKINKEKLRILPYNDTSVTHYYGSTSQKYSIQAVQVFIETGLPLYRDNVNFYKKEDWYSIFKNIYTIYPYPCLFFSLQYGNESKFIKRISEDYAYCNQLRKIHSSILLCVLKAYQDENTPSNIKNGVLAFAQIFFKMIPASVWRAHFETIAKTILEQNTYRDTYD